MTETRDICVQSQKKIQQSDAERRPAISFIAVWEHHATNKDRSRYPTLESFCTAHPLATVFVPTYLNDIECPSHVDRYLINLAFRMLIRGGELGAVGKVPDLRKRVMDMMENGKRDVENVLRLPENNVGVRLRLPVVEDEDFEEEEEQFKYEWLIRAKMWLQDDIHPMEWVDELTREYKE